MRKLGLLLWMLAFTAVGAQAQNIIKSLERTVPGQGKVTIHQDPKIEALIGVERPSMGEQKVLKAAGFRIQAYAGNNTREAKNDASCSFPHQRVFPRTDDLHFVQSSPLALSCG